MVDRRLPQYSLKTLLVVVTGVCLLAAFVASCAEIAATMLIVFCIATAPGYCFGSAINALLRSRISRTPPWSPNGRFQARIAALIPRRLPIVPVSAATACTLLCVARPTFDIGPELVGVTIIFIGASVFGAVFPCRLQTTPTLVATTWTLLLLAPYPCFLFRGAASIAVSLAFAAASVLGIAYARTDCRAFFVGSVIPTLGCVIAQIAVMLLSHGMRKPAHQSLSEVIGYAAELPASMFWFLGAAAGVTSIAIRRAIGRFRSWRY